MFNIQIIKRKRPSIVTIFTETFENSSFSQWTFIAGTPQIQTYGTPGGWPTAGDSLAVNGGSKFSYGGSSSSSMRTDIELNNFNNVIGKKAFINTSAAMGGYLSDNDNPSITTEQYDISNSLLNTSTITVLPAERGNQTKLITKTDIIPLNPATTKIRIIAGYTLAVGGTSDAYIDNIIVTLS